LNSEFLVLQQNSGVYTIGDFMTKKEDLHVVKPMTNVDEGALSPQYAGLVRLSIN
jgi:hypothetical protein